MKPKVSFVPHDDDRDRRRLPAATDLLQLQANHVEAATVADTVDQDDPVGPLQLFVADGWTRLTVLTTKQKNMLSITIQTRRLI